MSASESAPGTANLQASIEKLIAETVRRSQSDQEAEHEKLKSAMQTASNEIESAQAAMQRALIALQAGLEETSKEPSTITESAIEESVNNVPAVTLEAATIAPTEAVKGPHRIDVIAHDVTIGIASGLQAFLRERPEVASAQTREFVNGELRLDVEMNTGLDTSALAAWISKHKGKIVTQTDAVIELRFGGL